MRARSRKKQQQGSQSKDKAGQQQPRKGRRFNDRQRQHALLLVASGMGREQIAQTIGTTPESVRRWVKSAHRLGLMPQPPLADTSTDPGTTDSATTSPETTASATDASRSQPVLPSLYRPKDPGQGLSEAEVDAILELKSQHPSYGPAQVRAQLKRFRGWRLSLKAIARVFRANGFARVHRGSRPLGPDPIRFEAPRRNALWQMDFAEMRVAGSKLYLLVILDDFSRFCVGHVLGDSACSQVAVAALRQAIARHGKPEAVRTDRAGAFVALTHPDDFARVLEAELIDHIIGHAYHPQGGGKVESLIGTVRRELWDVEHFDDRAAAEKRLAGFIADYNERRAHMGIDGLTPADRYFARADRVLATIDAISRRRQATLPHGASVIEELAAQSTGAPLEVLRLCIVDGQMELRFCGARVLLGRLVA